MLNIRNVSSRSFFHYNSAASASLSTRGLSQSQRTMTHLDIKTPTFHASSKIPSFGTESGPSLTPEMNIPSPQLYTTHSIAQDLSNSFPKFPFGSAAAVAALGALSGLVISQIFTEEDNLTFSNNSSFPQENEFGPNTHKFSNLAYKPDGIQQSTDSSYLHPENRIIAKISAIRAKLITDRINIAQYSPKFFNLSASPTTQSASEKTLDKRATQDELYNTFLNYASIKVGNSWKMTPEDFVRSVLPPGEARSDDNIDTQHLRAVFRMIETEPGLLSFEDYLVLETLLSSNPEAEFQIAFALFDKDKDGHITLNDFSNVLKTQRPELDDLDLSCEFFTRYFGTDGSRKLTFDDFTSLLQNLQREIVRQQFQHYDLQHTGYIDSESFAKILGQYGTGLPPSVRNQIHKLSIDDNKISYPQFVAFFDIAKKLDTLALAMDISSRSSEINTQRGLNRKSFFDAVQSSTGHTLSPLEIDTIFSLLDTTGDGRIYPVQFVNMLRKAKTLNRDVIPPSEKMDSEQSSTMNHVLAAVKNFSIGSIAGATGAFVVYPIDSVKTRLQAQREVKIYKGAIDCFKQIIQKEGFLRLYDGVSVSCIGVAPEKAVKLVVNSFVRDYFQARTEGGLSIAMEVLAGLAAGFAQPLVTTPYELIKTRRQQSGELSRMHGIPKKTVPTIVREVVKESGFLGLFRGYASCTLRDAPFSGIFFSLYYLIKNHLTRDGSEPTALDLFMSGTLAGAPSAFLVTPFDAIKTRLQAELRPGEKAYANMADCVRQMYQKEGFKSFWNGALMRVIRSSPQFGVTMLVFSALDSFLHKRNIGPQLDNPNVLVNAPIDPVDYHTAFRKTTLDSVSKLRSKYGL